MTDVAYRRLTSADVATLRTLSAVFSDAFDDEPNYAQTKPSERYLTGLLAKPDVIALVAELNGRIVGGLVAYVLHKFEQERREVYIYDLAVIEAYRRRGIATGCIAALKRIAADIGAYVIYVQADVVDAPAIALYERLGSRITAYHFDIDV